MSTNIEMKNGKTWLGVFVLIVIEQAIKIVINANFLDKRFPILPPFLYFEPMFNRHYSWFNSMLQLGIGKWLHIAVVAIMSILIFLFYQYINKEFGIHTITNAMFAFIFSGAMCSLVDKVVWDGSLDYILVRGLFIFDLKDVYINVFIGLLILSMLLKNKVLKQMEDKNILNGFISYLLRKA